MNNNCSPIHIFFMLAFYLQTSFKDINVCTWHILTYIGLKVAK